MSDFKFHLLALLYFRVPNPEQPTQNQACGGKASKHPWGNNSRTCLSLRCTQFCFCPWSIYFTFPQAHQYTFKKTFYPTPKKLSVTYWENSLGIYRVQNTSTVAISSQRLCLPTSFFTFKLHMFVTPEELRHGR